MKACVSTGEERIVGTTTGSYGASRSFTATCPGHRQGPRGLLPHSAPRGAIRVARHLIKRDGPHHEGTGDEQLSALKNCEWVADVLGELPPAQREVMGYTADGLDRGEIAGTLGISRKVVRRSLRDARKLLTRLLNPDGEFKQPAAQRHALPGRRPDEQH